jgi:hypothetical protein
VEILERASARRNAPPKEWSDAETAGFRTRAAAEVEALAGRQERLRREILDRPGPRVVIEVAEGAEPFRTERFDPINLSVLGAGEVAHPHFITLVGPSGSIDLTNAGFARGSHAGTVGLTASAGRRPLGDGIRRLTVVGIQGAPQISHDGKIVLTAPGLRVELRGVDLRVDGETIRITVPPPLVSGSGLKPSPGRLASDPLGFDTAQSPGENGVKGRRVIRAMGGVLGGRIEAPSGRDGWRRLS